MSSPQFDQEVFDLGCRRCNRLARFLDLVGEEHPDYHAKPVPPFGEADARLLIVGLAPGKHGANATGRPFTGDYAGVLLYETLYKFGFSSAPESVSRDDGLRLRDCRITNAVKCLPPENKPTGEEIRNCNDYLRHELERYADWQVVIALGLVAHNAVLKALDHKRARYKFAHGAMHELGDGRWLIDSYHCSRYNTQTRRLTPAMFEAVFAKAREQLQAE